MRTLAETRKDAAATGWGFKRLQRGRHGGRDYCPAHSGRGIPVVSAPIERAPERTRVFTEEEVQKAAEILKNEGVNAYHLPLRGIRTVRDLWETERLTLINARDLVYAVIDRKLY
jgi:hypothetical protein